MKAGHFITNHTAILLFGMLFLSDPCRGQEVIFFDDFESYDIGANTDTLGYKAWQNDFIIASDGQNQYVKSASPVERSSFWKEGELKAGKTYEWTVSVRRDSANSGYILSVRTSDNTVLQQQVLNNGEEWVTSTLKFTVARRQENLRLQIWQTPAVEIFVDDFQLVDTQETEAFATLLPNIFSDGMVLQRNTQAKIWGKDKNGQTVTINTSWNNQSYTTTANQDGNWSVMVETTDAGWPYEIQIDGTDEPFSISEVYLGDVWLCSGQSNMAWTFNNGVDNSEEIIANSENPLIRSFDVPLKGSLELQDNCSGAWRYASPSTLSTFKAVPYFLGKMLQDSLNVPIGLLTATWGGSRIEAWIDSLTLSQFDFVDIPQALRPDVQRTPRALYNAMIHPVEGFSMKGATWYQGEANRSEPEQYRQLLPAMIDTWRSHWGQGEFPFYYVQIAPFANENLDFWQMLTDVMLETDNTGMVVTMDVGDCADIHPTNKKPVGDRLARWALKEVYGFEGFDTSGPIANHALHSDNELTVYFDYAASGIKLEQNSPSGFQLAGEDQVFVDAEAHINDDHSITLTNSSLAAPRYASYGYGACNELITTLFSHEGLPGSAFQLASSEAVVSGLFEDRTPALAYPNPTKDFVQVKYAEAISEARLLDQTGKEFPIQSMNYSDNTVRLDVSELPSGMYFIMYAEGTQKKFLKLFKQ